jgi:hypothetical protein
MNGRVRPRAVPTDAARRRARAVHRVDEGWILEKLARLDRVINAADVRHDDAARTHVEVADLGVAHHAGGQPDARARRLDQGVRILFQQLVVEGHLGEGDGVALALRRVAEAVEDDKRKRAGLF